MELLPASGMLSSSKDYYPSVAIAALMTALRNPAASAHQNEIFNAMFKILQTLGMDAEHYLKQARPALLPLAGCHRLRSMCSAVHAGTGPGVPRYGAILAPRMVRRPDVRRLGPPETWHTTA